MFFGIIVLFLLCETTFAIISNEFEHCRQFFFQHRPPQLTFRGMDEANRCICQDYNGHFYFATLYDTVLYTPLYSAYRITNFNQVQGDDNNRKWRKDDDLEKNEQPRIGDYNGVQAMDLNRGHLATRFYFPTIDARKAADVLTNIALQYKEFNQLTWKRLETIVYRISDNYCHAYGGVSYFITGVYPGHEPFNGIYIPIAFWSAVCCDTSGVLPENRLKGWSFAYVVGNSHTGKRIIQMFTVKDFLLQRGMRRYHKLFEDIVVVDFKNGRRYMNVNVENCLFDSNKAAEIVNIIVQKYPDETIVWQNTHM